MMNPVRGLGDASAPGLLDAIFTNAGIGLCLLDENGCVLRANERWTASAGVQDGFIGTSIWELFPLSPPALRALHDRVRAGETIDVPEHRQVVGGREIWYEGRLSPVPLATGTGVLITAWDITERKRVEQALLDANAQLRQHVTTTPLAVVEWDAEYRVRAISGTAEQLFGWGAAEVVGKRIDEIPWVPEEYWPAIRQLMAEMASGARPTNVNANRNVRKDGSTLYCEWYNSALHDAGGRLTSVLSLVLDVTARQVAEQALRDSEERYRTLFTSMTEGFAVGEALADASGRYTDFCFTEMNEAFEAHSGLRRDAVRGRPMTQVLPHLERHWVETYCGVAESGRAVRFESYNGDLDRFFDVYCYRSRPGQFAILFTDITVRRRAEAALRESEDRFRALADNIPQLAWMADASGSISWFNQRCYEFTGASLADLQGWGWARVHHPDHRERVLAQWQEGLASGEEWEDTFPLRGADGGYRWFLSRAKPLRDASGQIVRWFGTNTDITAEREAQEALREADRRKDAYLAILSHELRNPLAPILNSVTLLERIGAQTEQAHRACAVIERQARHLARIVDDLLDVTRIAHGKIRLDLALHDARDLVRKAVDDQRALFTDRGVSLSLEAARAPLWVRGDATRLAQILTNLLTNAAKFSEPGGAATVTVSDAGGQVEVRVRDDGAGIPRDLLNRLFEPFVQGDRTLARVQGGLGLGLALVKGLVELHGGSVHALSDGPDRGAEFIVRIPLANPPAEARKRHGDDSVPSRRILIVEDHADAADTLAEILELSGHTVRIARDGRTGIAAAREFGPDVVVCDIGLPDVSGYEVARALREDPVARGARLIALTGYALPEDRARAKAAGFDAHLSKPPSLDALEALLRGGEPR